MIWRPGTTGVYWWATTPAAARCLQRSRVLCWQSGHDAAEWTHPGFKLVCRFADPPQVSADGDRLIFQQGIEWLARRR